jgi:hypothetical protein
MQTCYRIAFSRGTSPVYRVSRSFQTGLLVVKGIGSSQETLGHRYESFEAGSRDCRFEQRGSSFIG